MSSFNPVFDPRVGEASRRRFDPFPNDYLSLVFKGDARTGGRPFYKLAGKIYSHSSQTPGWTSTGGAGFGMVQRNGVWQSVPANEPMIGDNGLGVWEARTNSIGNPTSFAAWAKNNGTTVTENAATSPSGQQDAALVANDGIVNNLLRSVAIPITSGSTVTAEVSLKKSSGADWVRLTVFEAGDSGNQINCWVNLATGAAGSVSHLGTGSGPVVSARPDGEGFTRVRLSGIIGTATSVQFQFFPTPSDTSLDRLAGNFWAWGPNLKTGANISDPPILQTTGLPATRTAVLPTVSGLALPSGDFDIEQEFVTGPSGVSRRIFEYHNGTQNERIAITHGTNNTLAAAIIVDGTPFGIGTSSAVIPSGVHTSTSLRRRGGFWQFIVDGAQVGADTACGVPSSHTLNLGYRGHASVVVDWLNSTISHHVVRPA